MNAQKGKTGDRQGRRAIGRWCALFVTTLLAGMAQAGGLVQWRGMTVQLPEAESDAAPNRVIAAELAGEHGPSVVFISGMDVARDGWKPVAARIAACARVIVYDRPGTGHSYPVPRSAVTPAMVADDLAVLLQKAGLPPPYVLVAHSIGGFYAQAFARTRPDATAGLVLVDAASPLEPPGVFVPTQPPPAGTVAAAEEAGAAAEITAMQGKVTLPPIPLSVIAATEHGDTPEREALWLQVQQATAALSPDGRLIRADGASHFVQTEKPDLVTKAILETMGRAGLDVSGCERTP